MSTIGDFLSSKKSLKSYQQFQVRDKMIPLILLKKLNGRNLNTLLTVLEERIVLRFQDFIVSKVLFFSVLSMPFRNL